MRLLRASKGYGARFLPCRWEVMWVARSCLRSCWIRLLTLKLKRMRSHEIKRERSSKKRSLKKELMSVGGWS